MRTYFTWYWLKQPDLSYLQNITQASPMTVFTNTQYPYTVFFDHLPFLDACYKSGIYVVLGIAIEGGNCFNFNSPDVSSAYQNFYLQTAQKLATLYGRHPAVMGFCMGNEQNNAAINTDSRVYVYYQQIYNTSKRPPPTSWSRLPFKTTKSGQRHGDGDAPIGQSPPTPFNNLPIEQAISMVVDVWGLNIYAGMSTDFPIYRTNVIQAGNGVCQTSLDNGMGHSVRRKYPRGRRRSHRRKCANSAAFAARLGHWRQGHCGGHAVHAHQPRFCRGSLLFRIYRRVVEERLVRSDPGNTSVSPLIRHRLI